MLATEHTANAWPGDALTTPGLWLARGRAHIYASLTPPRTCYLPSSLHPVAPPYHVGIAMAGLKFPPIYLLSTHMEADELHGLEEQIPSLTYAAHEADVILGKITMKKRAQFELRCLKLPTNETPTPHPAKRRKTHGQSAVPPVVANAAPPGLIRVVKLAWFTDSVQKGRVLPVDDYLLYQVAKPPAPARTKEPPSGPRKRPPLLPETTSEHDMGDTLPPVPAFLHTAYSCQRPTPANPPNAAFVQQLEEVRKIRTLLDDAVKIRAYCTSIAAVAAYPHVLSAPQGTSHP